MREEGRKEGRKEGKKEGRREGKEGGEGGREESGARMVNKHKNFIWPQKPEYGCVHYFPLGRRVTRETSTIFIFPESKKLCRASLKNTLLMWAPWISIIM